MQLFKKGILCIPMINGKPGLNRQCPHASGTSTFSRFLERGLDEEHTPLSFTAPLFSLQTNKSSLWCYRARDRGLGRLRPEGPPLLGQTVPKEEVLFVIRSHLKAL